MSGWKNIKIEKTQKSANGAMENDVELQRRSTQSRNVSRFSLMSTLELFLSFFLFFFPFFPPSRLREEIYLGSCSCDQTREL
jgi:hypothetical protein